MAPRQKHGARTAPAGNETLAQADLSHLRLQDMTPEQRAELRRRYGELQPVLARHGVTLDKAVLADQRRTLTVRAPPPAGTRRLEQTLDRLEQWLRTRSKKPA